MPIHIDEAETRVDVRSSDQPTEAARTQPAPDALPEWRKLARRDADIAERTAAWGFDD